MQNEEENGRGKEKSYSRRQITSNWSRYDKDLGQLNLKEDDMLTDEQRLKSEDERFQLMLQSSSESNQGLLVVLHEHGTCLGR